MNEKKNEIILFENQGVKLEVNLKEDTVWLTQAQMGILFDVKQSTLSEHINNIFKEGELEEKTSIGISDKSSGGRKSKLYNLDVIISVGYRVKSKNGVIFRQWANKVLKDYMLKGYAVNQRRLEYLEKTVKLIDIANRIDERLEGSDAKEILKVIFTDGNKRIAATLFIYFLNFYEILYKNERPVIDNNTLAALTLLIAESNPKEKDVIIDLVMNFLNND